MKILKEVTLDYATVRLYEPKFVRVEIHGEIVMSKKETKELNDIIGILSNGKEIPVMILADPGVQFDSSSREFSASEEGFRYTKAEALIIATLAHRIIADFYLKINKPPKPCKTFSNEQLAIEWLLGFERETTSSANNS